MKIPFCWCDISNFGDALNPIILEKIGGCPIRFENINSAMGLGIGSLCDMSLADEFAPDCIQNPISVFSTGFGFKEGGFFHNPDIILPEKLKRNVRIYALRGKLTQSRFEKLMGKKLTTTLGDGGLLASYLIDASHITKIYDLGIVPHYADKNAPIF